ncbi:MAG: TVP38/TMEM64 family protein [Bacilli bacterium]|nr:TVP38/TMEM64 family protein [Bacilli bacterium]
MENIFDWFNSFIDSLVNNLSITSALICCFLITIESIVPVLPLFAFITVNFLVFGKIIGFIISYIFTVIGCSISFFLFRKLKNGYFKKKSKEAGKIIKTLNKIKLTHLAVVLAVPFTPAFAVNIAAALSKMPYKKYLTALLIGKIFLVYFWGFVGTSLLDSIKNPIELAKIGVMMLIAYLISVVVNKKYKLD